MTNEVHLPGWIQRSIEVDARDWIVQNKESLGIVTRRAPNFDLIVEFKTQEDLLVFKLKFDIPI